MKNDNLIRNLGPNLLHDYSWRPHSKFWGTLLHSFTFWAVLLGLLSWLGFGVAHAQTRESDPMVMKVYPDGTKVVLRWSEVGKQVDNGEKYGGAPRIVAYDPSKEGIVPIGEPSSKAGTTPSTNAIAQGSSSVVAPQQPAKREASSANPDNIQPSKPTEGFYVGLQLGGAVVQNIDLNYSNGSSAALVLNPGIRLDTPIGYRVNDWFSVEFAPGMTYNKFQDIQIPQSQAIGGYLLQVPLIVNAILTIPTDSPWEPVVGAGFGGVFSKISTSGVAAAVSTGPTPINQAQDSSGSSWAYGYSFLGGLNYHLDKDISVGFLYKFMGTTGQNWTGDILGTSTTVFTQSVEANATFRF